MLNSYPHQNPGKVDFGFDYLHTLNAHPLAAPAVGTHHYL